MSSESQREAFWAKSIPSRLTNVKSWSEHITDKQLSFSLILLSPAHMLWSTPCALGDCSR